jgi:hypothetical protein
MKIAFSAERLPTSGCLVLTVSEGPEWGDAAKTLNKKSDGHLSHLAKINQFKGK